MFSLIKQPFLKAPTRIWRAFLPCLLLFLLCSNLYGQSSANYSFSSASNGSLISMSSGTTLLHGANVDETTSANFNIGFEFWFMGMRYTQFNVSSNGYLRLGSVPVSGSNYNLAQANQALITPFGGDFKTSSSTGKIHYKVTGTSPNRVLVVEFLEMSIDYQSTSVDGTYQLLLHESTGVIQFIYGEMAVGSASGTSSPFWIGMSSGSSSGQFATITSGTPSVSTTTATSNTYTIGSTISDLNSTSNSSRVVYTLTPPQSSITAPTSLGISQISAGAMTLKWKDNSNNESGFAILRSIDNINFTQIALTAANDTQYTATGLAASTTYYWQVAAVTEGKRSGYISGSASTTAGTISGIKTIPGDYGTITAAIQALTLSGLAGHTVLELQSNYSSSNETFPIVINPIPGSNAARTLTIRPASNATALSVTSSASGPAFDLAGASYITIDGRPGGTGTTRELTISNTSTSGQAIRFINGAMYNTIRNSIVKGVNTSSVGGVILFSNTSTSYGNSYNTIQDNHIRDGASRPAVGIYSTGTTTALALYNTSNNILNNSIFNYFHASVSSAGISLTTGNTEWKISGNSFYQTSALTATSGLIHYGITISSTLGYNFIITNNTIGGSNESAGGSAWTISPNTLSNRFVGINLSVGTVTASEVQGNTITNFSWATNTSTTTAAGVWAGISVTNGNINIGTQSANTIGATTGTGAITTTTAGNGGLTVGINSSSGGIINIANNVIGGITANGSTTSISASIVGIQVSSGQLVSINNNIIGSTITANSLNMATASTSATGAQVTGILHSGSTNVYRITNNTIANLNNNYTGTAAAGQVRGIAVTSTSGFNTITGNTIRNLATSSTSTGTAASASVVGIAQTSTSIGQVVSGNTIHSLSNSAATAAVNIVGINYTSTTSGDNIVSKNYIHSFWLTTTSTTASMTGINVAGGAAVYSNNVIRLGINESGNAVTTALPITGILKATTASNNFYFNNVYIGGTGVGTSAINTFAFRRTSAGVDDIRNNIFVNARSNSTTGGKHFAYVLEATTTVTSNHNIYFANGTGGVLASVNGGTTDRTTIQALRENLPNQDWNSGVGNPNFTNPTGNASQLSLKPGTVTPAEGAGIVISGINEDIDNNSRSALTPTDIGAYAGNFTAADIFTPVISVTPFGNTTLTSNRTLQNVIITDISSGVPTTGGNVPRIYFRNQTTSSSWASAAGTLVSGNGNNGSWSFTINYSSIGGTPTLGDVIQYYIVAEDQASTPNVWYMPFAGANHSSVNTQVSAPTTPYSYTIVSTALSGTVTVGSTSGANYTSLTGSGGLFEAINGAVLSGNLVAEITSDLTEDGTNALNQWGENGTGGYTLTIRSSTGTERLISGSVATGMIRLNGADKVMIDGRISGSGRYLRFRNSNTTNPVFTFLNEATNNTIRNSIVEGANTTTTSGLILFSTSTGLNGNSYNTFTENMIRDLSNTSGNPANLFYSSGTVGMLNSSNAITDNEMLNFTSNGVNITATGAGNNWNISGNAIYMTSTRTTAVKGIMISGGSAHIIRNNSFGGASATRSGTIFTVNTTTGPAFEGINLSVLTAGNTIASGNTFGNIYASGTGSPAFTAIRINSGNVQADSNFIGTTTNTSDTIAAETVAVYGIYNSGTNNIWMRGNTISKMTGKSTMYGIWTTGGTNTITGNTIRNLKITNSTSATLVGILSSSTIYTDVTGNDINNLTSSHQLYGINTTGAALNNNVTIHDNKLYKLSVVSSLTAGAANRVILVSSSGTNTITSNIIYDNSGNGSVYAISSSAGFNNISGNQIYDLSSTATGTTSTFYTGGIHLTASTTNNIVEQNTIYNLSNAPAAIGLVDGMFFQNVQKAEVRRNTIYNLTSSSTDPVSAIYGIYISSGSTIMSNNMISFGAGLTNDLGLFGIHSQSANLNQYYFNTINIAGSATSGTNNTYTFRKGSTGAEILRNNIFYNSRSGGSGAHFALGNIAPVPEAVWSASTSDYNVLYSANSGTIGDWGGTFLSLANWRLVAGSDLNSIVSTLGFVSAGNLHLTSGSCEINGKGIEIKTPDYPVTIAIDIDADPRNNPPTPGADELGVTPVASFTASKDTICPGSFSLLTANTGTGFTYQWMRDSVNISGATASTYSAMVAGSYIVEVTAPGLCPKMSAPKTITVSDLKADAGPDKQVCPNSGTTIGSSTPATGGTGQYTISWSPSTGLSATNIAMPTATVATTTDFVMSITDAKGCTVRDTVKVEVLSSPTPSISGDKIGCANRTHVYSTTLNAGTTYSWSVTGGTIVGSSTSNTVSVRWGTGTLGSVKVTQTITAGGCFTTTPDYAVSISQPAAVLNPIGATTRCQGDSVILSANTGTGFTYRWLKDGVLISGITSAIIPAKTSGVYRVIVTNSNNCTDTSSSVNVTINALPSASISASGATTFCQGGNVTLNANTGTGLTYQWRRDGNDITGATSASYNASQSGSYSVRVTNANTCSVISAASNVTVNALPVAVVNAATTTTRCMGDSVMLTANTAAGNTYQWRMDGNNILGATSFTYAAKQSGNYKVVVTNANNCVDSSNAVSVTINQVASASISAAGATTFCQGGNVTLNANTGTGLTYQWKRDGNDISGATSASYLANQSGNYSVFVNNGNNCSAVSSTLAVTVNARPTASATAMGATTFCAGDSVILNANTGTGLTYQWKMNGTAISGATNSAFTAKQAGDYRVVITNANSCNDSSSVIRVIVNQLPVITVNASGPLTFCEGGRVTLSTALVAGYDYQWMLDGSPIANANTPSLIVNKSGNYGVMVTNSGTGCSAISSATSVTVNPLPVTSITASGNAEFCNGENVMLTAAAGTNYIYQWLKNGVNITGANGTTFMAVEAGNYTVQVTDSITNCKATSSAINVTVNALPVAAITPAGNTTFCEGGSVKLNAASAPGITYTWLKDGVIIQGENADTLISTMSGSYALIVKNASGCSDTSAAVQVVVNEMPVAQFSAADICRGDSAVFTNASTGSGATYRWYFGDGTPVATSANPKHFYTAGGNYIVSLVVTSPAGCTDSVTNTIRVGEIPNARFTAVKVNDRTYRFTAADSTLPAYSWNMGDGNVITGISHRITYTYAMDSSFKVTLTAGNLSGCKASSDTIFTINTGIVKQEIAGVEVSVYPNPFIGQTNISYTLNERARVRITILDILGKEVAMIDDAAQQQGKYAYTLDAQKYNLRAGMYLVKIVVNNTQTIKQIIHQK